MPDGPGEWVDKDAFVLPLLPAELMIDPSLAALLHSTAFLELSGDHSVDPDWAVEALEHVAYYLQRLTPEESERLGTQLERIAAFGREHGWPERVVNFIRTFLSACGVGESD